MCFVLLLSPLAGGRPTNADQIVGNNTPANPAFKAWSAMRQAAFQPEAALEQANASFHPGMPGTACDKPVLVFVGQPFF